ncbi:efflux RND transporter permease subunit [Brucella abortus]|nr:efflux RND transporter permease subunit [Brucella abortus]
MNRFFVDRPVFAAVISIVLVLAGLICIRILPVAQYPELSAAAGGCERDLSRCKRGNRGADRCSAAGTTRSTASRTCFICSPRALVRALCN